MIEIAVYRMRIGLNYSRQIKVKGIGYLDYFESLVIMALLLLSGIERNPGPFSNDSVSSVSTIQDENIIKDFLLCITMYRVFRIKLICLNRSL